jgi:hypothetical protein
MQHFKHFVIPGDFASHHNVEGIYIYILLLARIMNDVEKLEKGLNNTFRKKDFVLTRDPMLFYLAIIPR